MADSRHCLSALSTVHSQYLEVTGLVISFHETVRGTLSLYALVLIYWGTNHLITQGWQWLVHRPAPRISPCRQWTRTTLHLMPLKGLGMYHMPSHIVMGQTQVKCHSNLDPRLHTSYPTFRLRPYSTAPAKWWKGRSGRRAR